ncbi:MAG: bacillithiol biosynthesis BshC, partial [bacterium]
MPRIIAKLNIEAAGDHNRLAREYETNIAEGLPPWLPGVAADAGFWRNLVAGPGGRHGPTREDVLEDVRASSERLGTGSDVLGKLQDATAIFVVTGQQPGTLGGALLVIYKAATAVALAGRLE